MAGAGRPHNTEREDQTAEQLHSGAHKVRLKGEQKTLASRDCKYQF